MDQNFLLQHAFPIYQVRYKSIYIIKYFHEIKYISCKPINMQYATYNMIFCIIDIGRQQAACFRANEHSRNESFERV